MVRVLLHCWLIIIVPFTVDIVVSLEGNKTIHDVGNDLDNIETRRNAKSLSTSSGDGAARSDSDKSGESLSMSVLESSSEEQGAHKKYKPQSTEERRGWRKWHRKCPKCPEDMAKKWRDKTIKWICGGYQRARRTFKSECMMHYRNCQDGTMFVKIHDQRCPNDTSTRHIRGYHFFYEYGKGSGDKPGSSLTSDSVKFDESI